MAENLFDQYRESVEAGPSLVGPEPLELPNNLPAKLIAFYLPQFHAITENDRWWGEGFTEWTNVAKSLPLFPGHYQPRMPGALGFYDLANPEVLRRQAELARRYGIYGFCFHHYWFGGHRLLERPLENLLADQSIDLPFCINWANESWTRRWDGRENEILIAQSHSAEDDLAFAQSIRPLFDDPRYIRVAGRPLLSLYRPGLFPDARATVERWREYFEKHGEKPLIVMVQGFDFDPRLFGMDGAIGFPPWGVPEPVPSSPVRKMFHSSFHGEVQSYEQLALNAQAYWPEGFRFYPGVCPSWDNTARRGAQATVVTGSTPDLYGKWLETAVRSVQVRNIPAEQLVFINAWNEWAESAYLEPDRHFGFAYLAATARALRTVAERPEMAADLDGLSIRPKQADPTPRWMRAVRRGARRGARAANALARALASI